MRYSCYRGSADAANSGFYTAYTMAKSRGQYNNVA